MKKGFWILILTASIAGCNNGGTTVLVKDNATGWELDTLGEKIEEKTEAAADSVKAVYNDIKERVKARIDSSKAERSETKD